MSEITPLQSTDIGAESLTTINTNFTNLNNAKQASFIVSSTSGYGDYTDIQTAINALPSTGGKIFIKAGEYTVTSPIYFPKANVILEGEGYATRIKYDGDNAGYAFKMADTTQKSGIQTRNMRISNIGPAGIGTAIDASYFALCRFSDLWIDGEPNIGIDFNATGTLYNYVENCRIGFGGANAVGVYLRSLSNENTLTRLRLIPGTGTDMIGVAVDSHANSLYDVDVESSADCTAFDIQGSGNDCTIIGCYSEGNGTGLRLAANVEATTVIGGIIIDSSVYNITNNGAKGLNILNLRLQYEQFSYRESLNGFPGTRWLSPYHGQGQVVVTSATPTAGTVYCEEFEAAESSFVSGISYVKGATQAGNVIVGIYGPITTEETCEAAPVLIQSASTAVSAGTNTEQHVAFTAITLMKPGRYYMAIEFDDASNTFQRQSNQTQIVGWAQTYARSGGYGALTNPAPAMTNTGSNLPGMKLKCESLTNI